MLRAALGAALCFAFLPAAALASSAPAGWLPPVDISATGEHAGVPQVVLDAQGNATAVWERSNGANDIVQAAYVAARGVLPLLSFGDGTSASAASATHTYAAPGEYTVTFSSTDVLGYASSTQRTIVIVPTAQVVSQPVIPVIESESVSNLSEHDATLEATIDTSGLYTGYEFQIDTNGSYDLPGPVCPFEFAADAECDAIRAGEPLPAGLLEPQPQYIPAGSGKQSVSLDLASIGATLQPGTTYHYRVIAADGGSPTVDGTDETFTTPGQEPVCPVDGSCPANPPPVCGRATWSSSWSRSTGPKNSWASESARGAHMEWRATVS